MKTSILQLVLLVTFVSVSTAFANSVEKPSHTGVQHSRNVVRPCSDSQLSIRPDPNFNDAAMGGARGASYIVKNTSATPCIIHGKPGIVLLDRRGRKMGHTIAPEKGGVTTIKGKREIAFEVGYHSCSFSAQMTGKDPKRCKSSRTAQIRFLGIDRVFTVKDELDAVRGIEQVEDWLKQ